MLDLGEFTPRGELPPTRGGDGVVRPGRLTTTDEQREQAIAHILSKLSGKAQVEGRAVVKWRSMEPSVISVRASAEHIDGQAHYMLKDWSELTLSGGEIKSTSQARMATLVAEVGELAKKDML